MMEFDFFDRIHNEQDFNMITQILPIDYEISQRQVIFKINVSKFPCLKSYIGGVSR